MRICRCLLLTISLVFPCSFFGQSTNAALTGVVDDPSKAVIAGAQITAINTETGVKSSTTTNNSGVYVLPGLIPGNYRIEVDKQGFKGIIEAGLVLHVQDAVQLNFHMALGSMTETVSVEANGLNINTTDASVSTVIDRTYVENMPLNGRSFQDLILLTPGVVTNSPQGAANENFGQFSVNGQRTESNYFMVDGVSANINAGAGTGNPSASASGSLPGSTALGTTQTLVSVDALQEFRVQSSTYSAEYGRNPGGQFSFVTRSGTNDWHGSAFDFLRNDYFDANDWFNDRSGFKQSALRQNDFGGTIGGPIEIPGIYHGKDKTFFFFSYEGLRLLLPQPVVPTYVPTLALRQQVPPALQPVLNAFPIPNGPDQGNGLAEFMATYSNPSQLDSTSVRIDHNFGSRMNLFFRFSDTPSFVGSRDVFNDLATTVYTSSQARTYTFGTNNVFSSHVSNQFRLNYSASNAKQYENADNFGGAKPVVLGQLAGLDAANPNYQVEVGLSFYPDNAFLSNFNALNAQRQWNLNDAVSWVLGRHQFKVGVDYRRLTPQLRPSRPGETVFFFSSSTAVSNVADFSQATNRISGYPVYTNLSVFAEDEWRATSRLSVSMGLRWELNPAPGATNGLLPYTVEGEGNLSTMTLAPSGTPLWQTSYDNFAPRFGLAYAVSNAPGRQTVIRAGVGMFYDTGSEYGSSGFAGIGFSALQNLCSFSFCNGPSASFPLTPAQLNVPVQTPPLPPYTNGTLYAFGPHLELPYTLQWNTSIQRALGREQTVTVSYVGANGRRLLQSQELVVTPLNPDFGELILYSNGLTSNYQALQVQFQRALSRGLQAIASYTWSHALDYGSQNSALPETRGNGDFDVRHNFSGALSWSLPLLSSRSRVGNALLDHWGLDGRFTARTGFPVTLLGNFIVDPVTGSQYEGGLDVVSGEPIYVHGSQYPGGRAINSAAFSLPSGNQAGDAPRNFLRGFGTWQADLAIRREFPIYERLRLQFRAEAFNAFNHPNFGLIDPVYGSPTFGQATQMLNQSLGALSPLYQNGGPRSLQFSLRVAF
jgi:hypothetical protein